jgi:prepilin-type processing-associated H-X9-DG protein
MWVCPEASRPKGEEKSYMPKKGDPVGMAWVFLNEVGSYGLNAWVLNPSQDMIDTNKILGRDIGSYSLTNYWRNSWSKAGNTIPVFGDMWFTDAWPQDSDPPPTSELCPGDTETFGQNPPVEMRRACVNRHGGYVNLVFMDWSVRKVGLKELWTLKWHKNYNTANKYTKAGRVRSDAWPAWMRKFQDY